MTQEMQPKRFNPNEHMSQLKSKEGPKDYLGVQWRLVWFREQCPQGTIDTDEVCVDLDRVVEEEAFVWNAEKRRSEKVMKQAKGYARFKAIVTDGKGGRSTGTKSENAASFPDYIEKAETGAIGRALAGLGYGTQFAGDEFEEHHRIVDSPVDRSQGNSTPASNGTSEYIGNAMAAGTASSSDQEPAILTEQQLESIRKLYNHLGQSEPEHLERLPYITAKKLIQQLTSEYRQIRESQPVQAKAVADMITRAKQRCEAIGVKWEDAKTDVNLRNVADTSLTVQQTATINGAITQYEKTVSKSA